LPRHQKQKKQKKNLEEKKQRKGGWKTSEMGWSGQRGETIKTFLRGGGQGSTRRGRYASCLALREKVLESDWPVAGVLHSPKGKE